MDDAVQPPHVLDPGAEARQGIRFENFENDVAKLDRARSGRPHEAGVFPFDAAITDRALRVVPDSQLGKCHRALPAMAIDT
jgi:hypothetical protein